MSAPAGFSGRNLQNHINSSRNPVYSSTYATRGPRTNAPGALSNSSWRTGAPPRSNAPSARPQFPYSNQLQPFDPAHAVTNASTDRTKGGFKRLAKCGTVVENWAIGDVFEFPHIVPSLNPRELNQDYKVPTIVGPVCPKVRKGAVLARYPDPMAVAPFYSSNKNGVVYIDPFYKLPAMSVVHPAERSNQPSSVLTDEVLQVSDHWKPYVGTHLCLNDIVFVHYGWPLNHFSSLDPKSIALLQKRYRIAQSIGFMDTALQAQQFVTDVKRDNALKATTQQSSTSTAPPKALSTTTVSTSWFAGKPYSKA